MTIGRSVGRERVVQFHLGHSPQALFEGVDVRSETGEMLLDGEGRIGDDEQPGRRTLGRLSPENLCDSHVLCERLVEKTAKEHREAVRSSQRYRLRRKTRFAALGFITPEEIRFYTALSRSGA